MGTDRGTPIRPRVYGNRGRATFGKPRLSGKLLEKKTSRFVFQILQKKKNVKY